MAIDGKLQTKIKKQTKEKFGEIYLHYFGDERAIDTEIDEIIKEIEEEMISDYEINEEVYKNLINRINKTKQRWVNKEVKEKENLYNEINLLAAQIYNDSKENFKLIYKVSNISELKEKRLEELNEWNEDIDIPITNFIYLKYKMNYQVKLALINDLKYLALFIMKDYYQAKNKKPITRFPKLITGFPIDATNRAKIDLTRVTKSDGSDYLLNKYHVSGDLVFETVIEANAFKSFFIQETISALNSKDIEVFMHLLSMTDKDFFNSREIVVPMINIVRLMYGDNYGSVNYDMVRDSLIKLKHISTSVTDSSNKGFHFSIIDNLDMIDFKNEVIEMYNNPNELDTYNDYKNSPRKIEMVRVVVNIDIVTQLVEDNTINMYSDVYNNFKSSYSKVIILKLQLERIAFIGQKPPLIRELGMDFFRRALFFADKKKYRNIKVVEEALNEIIESKITLKSFTRVRDTFILELYPISEEEKRELFTPNAQII